MGSKINPGRYVKRRQIKANKPHVIGHRGYVMVFMGYDHHLAAPNGYAYEHRVVAEGLIGRRLDAGEIVHHKDGNKRNNQPNNLEVAPSRWHHNAKHRKLSTPRQAPGQPNEQILCACGCGQRLWRFNSSHVEVRFISGHNTRLRPKLCAFPKPKPGQHNRIKTSCPSGHEYTPENTRMSGGFRICRACHRLREASRRRAA